MFTDLEWNDIPNTITTPSGSTETVTVTNAASSNWYFNGISMNYENRLSSSGSAVMPFDMVVTTNSPGVVGSFTDTITLCDEFNICGTCDYRITFSIKPIMDITVYHDQNYNGIYDVGETLIQNVNVALSGSAGSCNTDSSGECQIDSLDESGSYTLTVTGGDLPFTNCGSGTTCTQTESVGARNTITEVFVGLRQAQMIVSGTVSGVNIDISDNDDTPTTIDNTEFPDTLALQSTVHTFSIFNPGETDLILGTAAIDDNTHFSISNFPSIVAPDARESFTITFSPTSLDLYSATISFDSNDIDATETQFNFDLQGQGLDGRLIVTGGPSQDLLVFDGREFTSESDGTEFFDIQPATTATSTFTLTNNGNFDLVISQVTESGSDPDLFTTPNIATTLAPGESTTLTVTYAPTPTSDGSHNVYVQIATDQRSPEPNVFGSPPEYSFRLDAFVPPAFFNVIPVGRWELYQPCLWRWEHNIPDSHMVTFEIINAEMDSTIAPPRFVNSPVSVGPFAGSLSSFICHNMFSKLHTIRATTTGPDYNREWPTSSFTRVYKRVSQDQNPLTPLN